MTTLESEHTESQRVEITRFFRRNFTLHSVEGGIYMGGMNFIAPATILPVLIGMLEGPGYLLNLAPYLAMMGFALPSLFLAHKIEKMAKVKPFIMVTGVFQRLPYLAAGVILLTVADSHPETALAAVFLAPLISGLSCGFSWTAWMGLVAKTILPERLCSVWAARWTISGLIGIAAGGIVFKILAMFPDGYTGFGILYLITFSILTLSYIFFSFIHETDIPPADNGKQENFRENIRSIPGLLKNDSHFRLFLVVRFFGNSVLLAMALIGKHGLNVTASPGKVLGVFVLARTIGSLIGNIVASYVGDRYGAKVILLIARVLIALSFIFVVFADRLWMFYLIFGIIGFAFTLGSVSMSTLPIKLTPKEKRATYLSVMSLINIPFIIGFGILGGILWDWGGNDITLPASLAAGLMLISIIFLLKLQEPKSVIKPPE